MIIRLLSWPVILFMKVLMFSAFALIALKIVGVVMARNGGDQTLYRNLHTSWPSLWVTFGLILVCVLIGHMFSWLGWMKRTSSGWLGQSYDVVEDVPHSELALVAWRLCFAFAFMVVFLII